MQASVMTSAPRVLLDTSIANLRTLAAFFADELTNCGQSRQVPTPEARACREVLMTISVLIPKLQAARYVVADGGLPPPRCATCEDD
jgi:hypothetical protein